MREFLFGIAEITLGMSLLILLMLILLKLIGGKFTAKCRYILWTLVMIRLAVPFSFGILPALIEVPVESEPEPVQIQIPVVSYTPIPQEPVTIPQQEQLQMPSPPAETPMFTEPEPEPLTREEISSYIPHLYLTGAAVFLLWNLLSYGIYTGRIVRSAKPADAEALRVYETVCRKKELHRPPVLLMSPGLSSPAAFGLLRRRIVLPDIDLSENGLVGTLSHEVTHCKRGDLWIKAVCLLARSFHWFNPLVHLAAFRCEMEMELSCDESVLTGCSEETRAAYGEVMLDIIRRCKRNRGSLTTHFNPKKNAVKVRFTNILYGSGKRKGLWLIAVCLVLCLIAGAVVACTTDVPEDEPEPEPTETPDELLPESSESGEYPSMEAYVNERMAQKKTISYYSVSRHNASPDSGSEAWTATANVTDTNLTVFEKKGEVAGLSEQGVLECWEYRYLLKLDVPADDVMTVDEDFDGWFDMDGQHTVVALRHPDGTYTVLMDEITGDGIDFTGYRDTYEEAIYDWYVTESGLDLPLYVEDWSEQITSPTGEYLGNHPVHRFDGDGWGIYIPVSAWYRSPDAMENQWIWCSSYLTGSMLTVDVFSHTLEDEYVTAELQEYTPTDRTNRIWELHADDIHSYYYYYENPDGGFWRVTIGWTEEAITDYPAIAIEPQVLKRMAESFVVFQSVSLSEQSETMRMSYLDTHLDYPAHWYIDQIGIFGVSGGDQKADFIFWLDEYRAYTESGNGRVWTLNVIPLTDFDKTAAHFMNTEGVDIYTTGYGSNRYLIGTDAEYAYVISIPTDVQFLADDIVSSENYTFLQKESVQLLWDFMVQNDITPNLSCPATAVYSPDGKLSGTVDANSIYQIFLNTVVAPYEEYIVSKEFLDLDGNSIPELILYDWGASANYGIEIFTIENGEVCSFFTGTNVITYYSDTGAKSLAPPSINANEHVFWGIPTSRNNGWQNTQLWFRQCEGVKGHVLYSMNGSEFHTSENYYYFTSDENGCLTVELLASFFVEAVDNTIPSKGWKCYINGTEEINPASFRDAMSSFWQNLAVTHGVQYHEDNTASRLKDLEPWITETLPTLETTLEQRLDELNLHLNINT